ncbi:MAG: thioredoxin TrxC [Gallionellaceae bacterium]|nr:MAG: thioredoxin TrxC [Gallionellaceae bacterium]
MTDSLHIVCPHCATPNRVPSDKLGEQPGCGKCKQALFTAHPLELSSANFMQHITRNDIPVLVDFWAPWCGPCRTMAPAFEQAAQQLEPDFRVAKLNTETAQELAARYGIRSIPTLALFKGGREVARQAGAMNAAGIVQWAKSKN